MRRANAGFTIPTALLATVVFGLAATLAGTAALAASAWEEIRAGVFGAREIVDGHGVLQLKAPFRPDDQRTVPIGVEAAFVDGRTIRSVTVIVDNNPSPVAAVFRPGAGQARFAVATHLRLNQQSDVRALVEASDGRLYMVSRLVRFAGGQAACAAPPTGDPAEVAANMGRMQLQDLPDTGPATKADRRVSLAISHPNHTGMQLDQLTLLYIPLRMVSRLEVRQGDATVFAMDGSIALAENPRLEFDYRADGATELKVLLKDSAGGAWSKTFPVRPAS